MHTFILILIFLGSSGATFPLLQKFIPGVVNIGESLLNPFNLWKPSSALKIEFLLYTSFNPLKREEITKTPGSIQKSSFKPDYPTKVLIHSYMSKLDGNDILFAIKDALLKENQYNVIIVDWTKHTYRLYGQAVVDSKAVGAHLATFLKFIMEITGAKAKDMHLIGQFLGSHIAGWAGARIPGLGRITGLDPVAVHFRSRNIQDRLDASDALFVDVIHTDGGSNFVEGFGMMDPIGHMDFYPNGGQSQPGCGIIPIFDHCDQVRAVRYFLESINSSTCRFKAVWCKSYKDFKNGRCPPQKTTVAEMGLHAKRIPGLPLKSKFFLLTDYASPFCLRNAEFLHGHS